MREWSAGGGGGGGVEYGSYQLSSEGVGGYVGKLEVGREVEVLYVPHMHQGEAMDISDQEEEQVAVEGAEEGEGKEEMGGEEAKAKEAEGLEVQGAAEEGEATASATDASATDASDVLSSVVGSQPVDEKKKGFWMAAIIENVYPPQDTGPPPADSSIEAR